MTTDDLDEVTAQRRRTMLIAGVVSLAVLLIGVGVVFAVLASRPVASKPPITPAEETSSAPVSWGASSSVSATSSTMTTPSANPTITSAAVSTTPTGQIVRSGRIAYRLGGQIWVAGEDGSGAKAVFASASGDYALSPDGKMLVVAQSVSTYALVNTASGAQLELVGPIELPSWSPDSSWLAYTAGSAITGYSVRRVNRDATGDALVVTHAAKPQIARDGKRVALTTSLDPGGSDPLQVYDISTKVLRRVPDGEGAENFAWAPSGVLYFAKDSSGTVAGSLDVANSALSKSSVVARIPASDPPASAGALYPGPDGSKVLFALTGDDGYSRLQIADVAAKKITSPTTLYDEYPKGWLLDGSAVLYIHGNAIQNEKTSLYRMRPDGTKRTIVVSGAGL